MECTEGSFKMGATIFLPSDSKIVAPSLSPRQRMLHETNLS